MKKIAGGVCAALGFVAGAVRAGIKRVASEKVDLAVVLSEAPCTAAGVFTTNRVQAAPVLISKKHLRRGPHLGVVLNSGNANACTGEQGMKDAVATAEQAARCFGGTPRHYLICSTGRIGVPLPMGKIGEGLQALQGRLNRSGGKDAAVAIMTSDTVPKECAFQIDMPGRSDQSGQGVRKIRVGGMAKGAGMINPSMATMLCVVTTDVELTPTQARRLLTVAVEKTFNRITVDGDMSTNDTVILLANGASGFKLEAKDTAAEALFAEALEKVCADLAGKIVRDGEGTTKVVEIVLTGARNKAQARKAAEAVANSVLLKCAWAGCDPNWGRIMDALGYSGAVFDPAKVAISYDAIALVKDGMVASPNAETSARKVAAKPEFAVRIDLGAGSADYRVWSSDLTEEYVRLNLTE